MLCSGVRKGVMQWDEEGKDVMQWGEEGCNAVG